jgi:hypothetical protein
MLLFLTQMVLFREIHVYLELKCIGQFGRKRAYLLLEKPPLPENPSKTNSIHTGKQCDTCPCFSVR